MYVIVTNFIKKQQLSSRSHSPINWKIHFPKKLLITKDYRLLFRDLQYNWGWGTTHNRSGNAYFFTAMVARRPPTNLLACVTVDTKLRLSPLLLVSDCYSSTMRFDGELKVKFVFFIKISLNCCQMV